MTQLTYNEAFDPYHAVFRFFRLRSACSLDPSIPFDMFRILDFYLLFPFRLQGMKLYDSDTSWRKISKAYSFQVPYGDLPDDVVIFSKMETFQHAAITSLVASGFLEAAAWESRQVTCTAKNIPDDMLKRCDEVNAKMTDFLAILSELKKRYPLGGRDGLKDRTGLLEYRYDPI